MSTHVERVLRWVVPVDDEPHEIGGGDVVLVAARRDPLAATGRRRVEVWTRELVDEQLQPVAPKRVVQVFATGQILEYSSEHVGSVLDGQELVWHVFEERA